MRRRRPFEFIIYIQILVCTDLIQILVNNNFMEREMLVTLMEKEKVTYRQLCELYQRCKRSLNELNEFHHPAELVNTRDMETFRRLAQLKTVARDTQKLLERVVKLEEKIECLSKAFLATIANKNSTPPLLCDRKLLPSQRNPPQKKKDKDRGHQCMTVANKAGVTPDKGHLLGQSSSSSSSTSSEDKEGCVGNSRKAKEVTWSVADNSTGAITGNETGTDSYEKVCKLIPELLDKFEEFHQSFSRASASSSGGGTIHPATSADVLKVMDGHLKLLESLDARLGNQGGSVPRDKSKWNGENTVR